MSKPVKFPGRTLTPEEVAEMEDRPTPEQRAAFAAELATIEEAERAAWREVHGTDIGPF